MNSHTTNAEKCRSKILLRSGINDDVVAFDELKSILNSNGYENNQYTITQSNSAARLEIEDHDSKKFDELVDQLWNKGLLASNDEEFSSWF